MKILIISRSTLFTSPGGDTVQIVETANALRNLGLCIDVKLTHEAIKYHDYDLLHFFNIIRPNDILRHIAKAQMPFVVSTIFVDYKEFEKQNRKGLVQMINQVLSADAIESLKALVRGLKGQEKLPSFKYLLNGHKRSIQQIIKSAAVLLPNSSNEYKRLVNAYQTSQKHVVVPNGIDVSKFAYKENSGRDIVLCVARFEPLKNQMNLIKALKNTHFKLVLIGNPSLNNMEYYLACKAESGDNVTFISHVSQDELVTYYRQAKVHVLPSWFETTGLSSLEAGSVGCNLVVSSKGDTLEYFENFADFCDPNSIQSIRNAVELAFERPNSPVFSEHVLKNYTWQMAAKATIEGYNLVTPQI